MASFEWWRLIFAVVILNHMMRYVRNLWGSKALGWRLARVTLCIYLGLLLYVMLFANSLIFYPSKYPEGSWEIRDPKPLVGQTAPRIEDVWLAAADGVRIHGWMATPLKNTDGRLEEVPTSVTILFCHGNAGNITDRSEILRKFVAMPAKVFIFDYRGYGRSSGVPSEKGVYADARAAWNYLKGRPDAESREFIVFGESLGGAVAVDLASKVNPGGLIVQSSFTSIPDMARTLFPIVPGFVIRTKMDSLSKIPGISCPKLFIHSQADEIVPYRLGRRLFEAATQPKEFYEVRNAGHNETDLIGGEEYLSHIREFLGLVEGRGRVRD